eukprot:12765980-Prorocentrum_lima.AAC.1
MLVGGQTEKSWDPSAADQGPTTGVAAGCPTASGRRAARDPSSTGGRRSVATAVLAGGGSPELGGAGPGDPAEGPDVTARGEREH